MKYVFNWIWSGVKSLWPNRSKRVDISLAVLNAIQTVTDSNVDDAVITVVQAVNVTLGTVVSGLDKGLVAVVPELIKIYEVIDVSMDSTDINQQLIAISAKLKEVNNIDKDKELSTEAQTVIKEILGDGIVTEVESIKLIKLTKQS